MEVFRGGHFDQQQPLTPEKVRQVRAPALQSLRAS